MGKGCDIDKERCSPPLGMLIHPAVEMVEVGIIEVVHLVDPPLFLRYFHACFSF